MQHTICALATGPGAGAVALVRLSGPESLRILSQLTRSGKPFEPRKQVFCSLYDGQDVLDRALVTYFKAPHSFTGEDVAEFSLHGSSYVKGRLLELLCQSGAVPAKRGEFSYRAFLNGKMDLLEAQGLCDLIASGNKAAHQLAMNSLDGKLSARLETIKKNLSETLAQIEVRLDDVDEEMSPLDETKTVASLQRVLFEISKLADTFSVGKFIKEGLKVAIVGAPNAGKSSLLNALVGFDRAIVSRQSGTTRDTIEETLDLQGQKIILTDTAGIRDHALDPAEQEGMKRSVKAMEKADVILFVLDQTRPLSEEEKKLWADVQSQNKKTILILNKLDASQTPDLPEDAARYAQVCVSCKTGRGLDDLKTALTADLNRRAESEDGIMISNLRQYEALINAQTELETAVIRLTHRAGGEIYAEHLRAALNYLKDLIGEVTPDDVLGIIFSKFCMGK